MVHISRSCLRNARAAIFLSPCLSAMHFRTNSARFRLAIFCWTDCVVHTWRSCLRNPRAVGAGEDDVDVCASASDRRTNESRPAKRPGWNRILNSGIASCRLVAGRMNLHLSRDDEALAHGLTSLRDSGGAGTYRRRLRGADPAAAPCRNTDTALRMVASIDFAVDRRGDVSSAS